MINLKISTTILAGVLLIAIFCRCNNHQPAITKKLQNTIKLKAEYIDWDSVRINGTVQAVDSPMALYRTLSHPDSVITPNWANVCGTFFDTPFKYVYIKGNEFEMRGDSIVVSKLDFKNGNLSVTAGGVTLNKNTTIASLAHNFPYAVQHKYLLDIHGSKEKLTAINLGLDKNYNPGDTDGIWILLFKDGKLVAMEYHLDC